MNKSIEISARTQEEAIASGLEQLGASISEVTIDILQEGSKGLFGLFGSRLAKVRLTLKEDADTLGEAQRIVSDMFRTDEEKPVRKEQPPKEDKPAAPAKPTEAKVPKEPKEQKEPREPKEKPARKESKPAKSGEAPGKAQPSEAKAEPRKEKKPSQKAKPAASKARQERKPAAGDDDNEPKSDKKVVQSPEEIERSIMLTKEYLAELTKLMGVEVTIDVTADEEGTVKADMEGDALGILIGRRGETLDALQYLTSLWVNKDRDQYTRVTLDSEHYRAKREEALIRLANRMANRVQKTGRRVSMEAMNPYERRIMHSALQSNEAVYTHSEGEGLNRHVVISPRKADKSAEN